ncbi:site-specific integrase [Nocardiopsis sp. NPDC049922]|uniref:tyrosine-type recombinase/integrase n=1 Tax=Nocardiopsis sp. NPDC049922 TaxID=3155157 RepID=UPI0033D4A64E
MAHTKDLWWRKVKHADGSVTREKSTRHGKGKRYLAVWTDPNGDERSRAFERKRDADRHGASMETDRNRGDYLDPDAGKVLFGDLAKRWFTSLMVDPASEIHYEGVYRRHVAPVFDQRMVKSIKPSDIAALVRSVHDAHSPSTAATALLVVRGVLEIAEADGSIKRNPARSKIVRQPKWQGREVQVWSDAQVNALVMDHSEGLRAVPVIAAGCGQRQGEIFGLGLEDLDFEGEVIHVRRQLKKLGERFVFSLPKNDKTRTVPMPLWVAEALKKHIAAYPPRPYTLPWETLRGRPHTVDLLFRWSDDLHVRARTYGEQVWKPALVAAGIIPEPTKDKRGRRRYSTSRKEGIHQLRHYYASVQLHEGVSVVALASYLGHDPKVTLSIYGHMLPSSDDLARKAIDGRFNTDQSDSDGT